MDPQRDGEEEKALQAKESQRQNILSQILSVGAKERLARIALVKPEKSRSVEDYLINRAMSSRTARIVSEDEIVEILSSVAGGTSGGTIVVERKRQVGGVDEVSSSDDEEGLYD